MTNNFTAFMKLDKSRYKGKYVVLVDGKMVGHGQDIESMLAKTRKKYPRKTPLVAKIPNEEVMIL